MTYSFFLVLQSESGIDPGMHISFKSSSEMIFSTLSAAHITSILAAQKSGLTSAKDVSVYQGQSISSEATNRIRTYMVNKVGIAVKVDRGHRENVSIVHLNDLDVG